MTLSTSFSLCNHIKILNFSLGTGSTQLSPYSVTILSGVLAVISVNMVIGFYIYMAMKEPSSKHEPDPKFLAEAEASIQQQQPKQTEAEDSSPTQKKQE